MSHSTVEIIGILATIIILISFVQTEIVKIRVINTFGTALFVIYGLLIHSYSITILNGILFFIHMYKISKGE